MKTSRTSLRFLGSAAAAILLFGVFRPALAAPQENSSAPSHKKTDQYVGFTTCKTYQDFLFLLRRHQCGKQDWVPSACLLGRRQVGL